MESEHSLRICLSARILWAGVIRISINVVTDISKRRSFFSFFGLFVTPCPICLHPLKMEKQRNKNWTQVLRNATLALRADDVCRCPLCWNRQQNHYTNDLFCITWFLSNHQCQLVSVSKSVSPEAIKHRKYPTSEAWWTWERYVFDKCRRQILAGVCLYIWDWTRTF